MVDIRRTTRASIPRIPFEAITRRVLGPSYSLSLVLSGDALAARVNAQYRKKSYAPNVLSFPLSETEGEIFLNVRKAEREARRFGWSARERIAYLFVHGLHHLGGYRHGRTMEDAEWRTMRAFKLAEKRPGPRPNAKRIRRN